MDILGVGGAEFVLVFILATVVLGPRRMIQLARELGRFIRDLRNYYTEFTKDLNEELAVMENLNVSNLLSLDVDSPAPKAAQLASSGQEAAVVAETAIAPTLDGAPALEPVQFASPDQEPVLATEPAEALPISTDANPPALEPVQPISPDPETAVAAETDKASILDNAPALESVQPVSPTPGPVVETEPAEMTLASTDADPLALETTPLPSDQDQRAEWP